MDKLIFFGQLAQAVKNFVSYELEPHKEKLDNLQEQLLDCQRRLYELENAKQPQGKLASIR